MALSNEPVERKFDEATTARLATSLASLRETLKMEVAYLSEFVDSRAVFRAVSAPGLETLVRPGQSMAIGEIYCKYILDGRLPNLIADTSRHQISADLPITLAVPIGCHVSVPVHRKDGSVFGMLCCLSRTPNPELKDADLELVRSCATQTELQLRQMETARESTTDAEPGDPADA